MDIGCPLSLFNAIGDYTINVHNEICIKNDICIVIDQLEVSNIFYSYFLNSVYLLNLQR